MKDNTCRLSKLMANRKICSRREADAYIEAGLVAVDGAVVSVLGTKVDPNCDIELLPAAKKRQQDKVTVILNKPLGYVSTQPEDGYHAAIELIRADSQLGGPPLKPEHLRKLSPAGRLDIDSKGLLVLTQDGALVKHLIGPDSQVEKEYLVRVEGRVNPEIIEKLRFGLSLDGQPLKPAGVDVLRPQLLRFTLKQGKKRQIRRMCELVGLGVAKLKRVRLGQVRLGDLPEGKWRFLKAHESF